MNPWRRITALPPGPPGEQGEPGQDGADGQDGNPGDRYYIYGEQGAGSHELQLYRVLQRWNGTDYETIGQPVPFPLLVAPQGEVGEPGQDGGYYVITQRTPADAPHVAIFERQLHNPAGQPVTPKQDFGGVIAPEGPVGQQGEPGPPGPVGPGMTVINNNYPGALPANGEWVSWSYAARAFVDMHTDLYLGFHDGDITTQATALIYSGVSIFINLDEFFSYIPFINPATIENLRLDWVREAAARLIYCQVVNHQTLTASDIQIMSENLGEPLDYAGDPLTAPQFLAAGLMKDAAAYPDRFKANFVVSRAQAAGRTAPDYSDEPCTPAYEDWNHVFDFTAGGFQGWVSGMMSGGAGQLVAGEGWQAYPGAEHLYLTYTFPGVVRLKQVEVISTNVVSNHSLRIQNGVQNQGGLSFHTDGTTGPIVVVSYVGLQDVAQLSVWGFFYGTSERITRISIAGLGDPPTFPPGA